MAPLHYLDQIFIQSAAELSENDERQKKKKKSPHFLPGLTLRVNFPGPPPEPRRGPSCTLTNHPPHTSTPPYEPDLLMVVRPDEWYGPDGDSITGSR